MDPYSYLVTDDDDMQEITNEAVDEETEDED